MDKAVSRFMVLLGRREGNLSLAPGLHTPVRTGPNPALNPRGKRSEEAQGEQHSHGKALQTMHQRFRNFGCFKEGWRRPAGPGASWKCPSLGALLVPLPSPEPSAGLGQEPGSGVPTQPCRLTHHRASASPCRASTEVAGTALPGSALRLFHPLIEALGHKPGLHGANFHGSCPAAPSQTWHRSHCSLRSWTICISPFSPPQTYFSD